MSLILFVPYFAVPACLVSLRLRTVAEALAPALLGSIVMGVGVLVVRSFLDAVGLSEALQLALLIPLGVGLYALCIWVLRPPAAVDLLRVVSARGARGRKSAAGEAS